MHGSRPVRCAGHACTVPMPAEAAERVILLLGNPRLLTVRTQESPYFGWRDTSDVDVAGRAAECRKYVVLGKELHAQTLLVIDVSPHCGRESHRIPLRSISATSRSEYRSTLA